MMFQIIWNHERDAINKEIDRFLAEHPEKEHEREEMFLDLLDAYRERGVIATLIDKQQETP